MKRFINDIRRIAKTKELESKIRQTQSSKDKRAIGIARGIGLGSPDGVSFDCQNIYTASDGRYTFEEIIDGTREPGIVDGDYNSCEQLNTITDMRDSEENLVLYLKPDNIALDLEGSDSISYWYFNETLRIYLGGFPVFPTLADAQNAYIVLEESLSPYYTVSWASGNIGVTLAESDLINSEPPPDQYRWELEYPIYSRSIKTTFDQIFVIGEPVFSYETFIGIPCNYNYSTDDVPGWETESGNIFNFPHFGQNGQFEGFDTLDPGPDLPASCSPVFQLLLAPQSGRWTPVTGEPYPLKYQGGVNIVDFCFGDGRFGRVRPAKDGGFVLMELATEGGEPTGFARVYRNNRTLAAIVPVNQLFGYIA